MGEKFLGRRFLGLYDRARRADQKTYICAVPKMYESSFMTHMKPKMAKIWHICGAALTFYKEFKYMTLYM